MLQIFNMCSYLIKLIEISENKLIFITYFIYTYLENS